MTSHWLCKLSKNPSVFSHWELSDIKRQQESCINTNFNHTILLWWPVHSFLTLFATDCLAQDLRLKVQAISWTNLSAQTIGQIVIPKTGLPVPTWQDVCSSHKSETAPQILSWLIEKLCDKQFQSFPHQRRCIDIFYHPCFWALLGLMDSWIGRLGVRFHCIPGMSEHKKSSRSVSRFSFWFVFGTPFGLVDSISVTSSRSLVSLSLVSCGWWSGRTLKVSWISKRENWRKNSLINQEPRSERNSPCCIVSENRLMRCGFESSLSRTWILPTVGEEGEDEEDEEEWLTCFTGVHKVDEIAGRTW